MNHKRPERIYNLGSGASYRIRVQGNLSEQYAPLLGNLTITVATDDESGPVTTLYGRFTDQAALQGVLNTLCNVMHMPLLSVERADSEDDPSC